MSWEGDREELVPPSRTLSTMSLKARGGAARLLRFVPGCRNMMGARAISPLAALTPSQLRLWGRSHKSWVCMRVGGPTEPSQLANPKEAGASSARPSPACYVGVGSALHRAPPGAAPRVATPAVAGLAVAPALPRRGTAWRYGLLPRRSTPPSR